MEINQDKILETIRESARIQKTAQNRENYFVSCENKSEELKILVSIVRKEYNQTY